MRNFFKILALMHLMPLTANASLHTKADFDLRDLWYYEAELVMMYGEILSYREIKAAPAVGGMNEKGGHYHIKLMPEHIDIAISNQKTQDKRLMAGSLSPGIYLCYVLGNGFNEPGVIIHCQRGTE